MFCNISLIHSQLTVNVTGQVWMGGCIQAGGPVTVTEDQEMSQQPDVRYHKGKRIYGGPHNIQLSLDGQIRI